VQSVPTYAVSKLVTVIKSITAREIFRLCPEVKKQLWGGVVHLGAFECCHVGLQITVQGRFQWKCIFEQLIQVPRFV
jgi:hypothetical protein